MHGLSITNSLLVREICQKISSFVAAAFLLAICPQTFAQSALELSNKLTTEQKVGQLMIWSFNGTEYSPAIEETLTKYQPGALIVFRRNIIDHAQIARLNSELQKTASRKLKAPLLIMIDQEGGVVTRVRINTPIPSALALGKVDDVSFVENFARIKGDLLQGLGFNVNLAPVMDISNPTKDTFIGNRTFGDEPETVSQLSMAYSKGMTAAGVLPTAKHFPGHGGTVTDSHQAVPLKMSTIEDLEERDFVPFKHFSESSFPGFVMMAHLALPNVDPQGLPATYSPKIIKEFLRDKLQFKGVVMTDDLEMKGAAITQNVGERAVRAFLAGNDMIMLAGSHSNQRAAYRAILNAVNEGRISRDRLNESVVRILDAKLQAKISQQKIDSRKAANAVRRLQSLSKEIMEKNFKSALQEQGSWNIEAKTATVVFGSSRAFFHNFRKNYSGHSRFYHLNLDSIDGVTEVLSREHVKLAVFYASGSKTARWLTRLNPALKAKMIVINCNHAGEVEDQSSFLSVFNLNSHSPDAGRWLAQALNDNKPKPLDPEFLPEPVDEFMPPDLRAPAGDME